MDGFACVSVCVNRCIASLIFSFSSNLNPTIFAQKKFGMKYLRQCVSVSVSEFRLIFHMERKFRSGNSGLGSTRRKCLTKNCPIIGNSTRKINPNNVHNSETFYLNLIKLDENIMWHSRTTDKAF